MKTSEEKIEYVQSQCEQIWQANRELPIDCPYCYSRVEPGEGVCCQMLDKAIRAIIERAQSVDEGLRKYEQREFGRQIMGDRYRI